MTDRVAGFLVTLDKDMRDDDSRPLAAAILQMRGVISVRPAPGGIEQAIADQRARHDIGQKLIKVLEP